MNTIITIFIALCIMIPVNLYAQNQDDIINKIQERYKGIDDFYANFRQDASIKALDKVQTANGELWIKKDAKMRWNYNSPGQDQIVSDGTNLWVYYKDENYVVKSNLEAMGSNPNLISLLSDLNKLKDVFRVKVSNTKEGDISYYLIDLIPIDSEDESVNKISLLIDQNTMLIQKMFLYDPFENLTVVKFNKIETNRGIKDSVFKFKVPKGVEVIDSPTIRSN